jgi:antirestriction protein ArdC
MAESTRTTEVLDRLTAGIEKLTSSSSWQDWLTTQSRFHKYSFGNTLLILLQTQGQATRVAGFHAWRKLGRHVRKGEKAIWILAPMTRKVCDDEHHDQERAEGARVLMGFKPVTVFDLAQTDGEPLPEIATRLQGDDPLGVYGDLERVAESIGFSVEDADFDGGKNGDCNFAENRIRVRAGNAPAQRVKTLAHEIAHALLHEGFTDRALAELEAESVAYVVCASEGIESDDYSFGYVAGWSGGGDEAIAAIRTAGGRIQQAAESILEKLEDLRAADDARVAQVA